MIGLIVMLCCSTFAAHATSALPAQNLWQLTYGICSSVDVSSSEIDCSLASIGDIVNDLSTALSLLDTSTIDEINSLVNVLVTDLDTINSLTSGIVAEIESFSDVIETVIDVLSTLENIDDIMIAGNCSCIDKGVGSLNNVISSELIATRSHFDSCCTTISVLDTIIKSDVDSVSTKVDSVSSKVSVVKSELDSCCSVVSKIHTCLIGTAINQAMMPYTITQPGSYYLCENVTTSGAPAITIAASNVHLNLNGQTITNTNNMGISCTGQSNVYIENGTIVPFLQAITITNSSVIQLEDILVLNAGVTSIDIETVNDLIIRTCTVNGTNGHAISSPAGIFLYQTGPAFIFDTYVFNRTAVNDAGFFISRVPTGTAIAMENCTSDTSTYGFYLYQDANADTNVFFRDCTASSATAYGFYAQSTTATFRGPYYENCDSQLNGVGFGNDNFTDSIYRNCAAENNTTGFLFLRNTNAVCSRCTAEHSSSIGFNVSTTSGTNTQVFFDNCYAVDGSSHGFSIDATNTKTILTDCLASGNTGSGINNASATTFIVDTRSQHAATTVNPAYNLNGVADVLAGGTTVVITS